MAKHGPVSSVRALRDLAKDARALDGSAFVVYETAEAALAAVKANGGVRDGRKIGVYAVLDWFDRQKKKKESMAKKRTSKRDREETEEAEAEAAFTVVSGVVLKFAGLGGTEASREDLKGVIEKHATVKYVEYSRGEEIGHVRLAEQGAAQKALDLMIPGSTDLVRTLQVGPVESAQVSVVSGEEETAYWTRAAETAKASRASRRANGKGGKGRGGGGKGKGKGGRGAKRQRT